MKKLALLALLAVVSLGATAQKDYSTWSITPKAGVNIAQLIHFHGDRYRVGFNAGVELEGRASKVFGVSVGAFYSQQGAKYAEVSHSYSQTAKLDYVNLPVLINLHVGAGFTLKAGLQPGFCVSAREKYPNDESVNIKDQIKPADLSVPVGISWEAANVVLDARYNLGVSKFAHNANYKNSWFQFSVGYRFNL